jgi:hypothetical protein
MHEYKLGAATATKLTDPPVQSKASRELGPAISDGPYMHRAADSGVSLAFRLVRS